MKLLRTWTVCVLTLPCWGAAVQAESYWDDFEAYADTAAMMLPGNWGDAGGSPNAALWPAPNGNPGQAMWHTGYEPAKHVLSTALVTSDAQPIVWEFDFYDDGAPGKRMSGGLRDNGGGGDPTAILEMGVANSLHPETGAQPHSYAIRTVFIGGEPAGLGGWVAFVENPAQVAGWHHFRATISASSILFELDLFDDGTIDCTRPVTTSTGAGVAYDALRLGSWGVSSPTGAGFDNVSIAQVPEPATLALVAAGLAGLGRRRGA